MKLAIFVAYFYTVVQAIGQTTTPTPAIQPPNFSLTIKALDKAFHIGQDALLFITFTNVTNHDIYFSRVPGYDNPEFSYFFSILNEGGENKESLYSAHIHDPAVHHHGSQVTDFLKPGASLEMKAHLNRIADLDKPGHYTVQVSRDDRAAGRVVTSNKVVVDIVK